MIPHDFGSFFRILLSMQIYSYFTTSSGILSNFTTLNSLEIQHFIVDDETEFLYVGSTNFLYRLNANLQLLTHFQTGPEMDSPYCNYNGDCTMLTNAGPGRHQANKTLSDNFSKILLISRKNKFLISCGSLKQGVCDIFTSGDFSRRISPDREQPRVPVASNAFNASTVAFEDPKSGSLFVGASYTLEPYRSDFPSVATRSLGDSRNFFHLRHQDPVSQSAMILRSENRMDFKIHYIYGFVSNGFAYWATVQRKTYERIFRDSLTHGSPLVSKLTRVCVDDLAYESYSEIPLECLGNDNSKYPVLRAVYFGAATFKGGVPASQDRLWAVFAKSDATHEKGSASQPTALCSYAMKDVEATFWFNADRCTKGVGSWNLAHFGLNQQCVKLQNFSAKKQRRNNPCLGINVGGTLSVTSVALLTYGHNRPAMTSLTVEAMKWGTVVFLGTSDGTVKKVFVESPNNAREFGEIRISKSRAAVKSLTSSKDQLHLYAVTYNQIFKVKKGNCSAYSFCDTCLSSGDPYCGWCTLENKCSAEISCNFAANSSYSFFRPGEVCLKITKITPSVAPLLADTVGVKIEFNYLPDLNVQQAYFCDSLNNASSRAVFSPPNFLTCSIQKPVASMISMGKIDIPIEIRYQPGNGILQRTKLTFFDCSFHKLCTDCLSSPWPCDWCISGNRCLFQTETCSEKVRLRHALASTNFGPTFLHADSVSHKNGSYEVDPISHCPQINVKSTAQILIPDSHPSHISVDVVNMQNVENFAGKDIFCVITVHNRETKVKGGLNDDGTIAKCEAYTYFYPTNEPTYVANFRLETNDGAVIDRLNVKLFKCEAIALDCTQCRTALPVYNCAWCRDQCRYGPSCSDDDDVMGGSNPVGSSICPAPIITGFEPDTGPWLGGTVLRIRGRDFGFMEPSGTATVAGTASVTAIVTHTGSNAISKTKHESGFSSTTKSVENGGNLTVLVANVPCRILHVESAQSFTCSTGAASGPTEGPVIFRGAGEGRRGAATGAVFRYVEPALDGFQPNMGPKSGGTKLTILGHHLLAATNVSVHLGAMPCRVDRTISTENALFCYTTNAPSAGLILDALYLKMDNANFSLKSPFKYMPDPTVNYLTPRKTFRSGGRKISVSGENFHLIQKPLMYLVDFDGRPVSESSICQVVNATAMICPSPSLIPGLEKTAKQKRNENSDELDQVEGQFDEYQWYNVGFQMDDVPGVRNLVGQKMTVLPDPLFDTFPAEKTVRMADPVVIEGNFLNSAAVPSDVTVTVGGQPCNVSVLAERHLICQISPITFKAPVSNTKMNVHVKMGNLAVDLGFVKFFDGTDSALFAASIDGTLLGSLAGALAAVVVLATVSLLAWWKRKSWRVERDYRRIQMQMDLLESNVRQECKQAFAELQTDMSDLTGDLVPLNIPYRAYGDFVSKVLFKNEQRTILQAMENGYLNGYTNTLRASLKQFDSLLGNRHFVLLLVECLEKQPTFNGQDKAYVGSLLSALLLQNLRYFSDVVFSLLQKLIQKTATDKNPHLMLRRSDTVVEKMLSNWISICAYDYLQQSPGQSLFLLFKALKHQIEKGPVDAMTSEARYSLSEDCLLKQSVVSEPVLLRVIPPNGDYAGGETVLCRVLSCDTISQVKSKILDVLYRNAPFTTRPSLRDIDLEWRCSGSLHPVALTDRPASPPSPNSKDPAVAPRNLLTVDAYRMPNHSVVGVVPKNSSSVGYSSSTSSAGSLHTYASITSSTLLLARRQNGPPPTINRHGTASRASSKRNDSRNESPDSALSSGNNEGGPRWWHLVRPDVECSDKSRGGCSIPEVYLTRLLATKGTVQHFIDDFFACVFNVGPSFPPAVKYLFNFLQAEYTRNGFSDPQILHSWKTNGFWLRFWVNFIKNPDFAFDVEKTRTLDACLSVLAQTFMDSCSTTPQRLGKDSPSAKLLFARDTAKYRLMCQRFFGDLSVEKSAQQAPETEMAQFLEEAEKNRPDFNTEPIAHELLAYVLRYKDEILDTLSADQISQCQQLPQRFEHIQALLNC